MCFLTQQRGTEVASQLISRLSRSNAMTKVLKSGRGGRGGVKIREDVKKDGPVLAGFEGRRRQQTEEQEWLLGGGKGKTTDTSLRSWQKNMDFQSLYVPSKMYCTLHLHDCMMIESHRFKPSSLGSFVTAATQNGTPGNTKPIHSEFEKQAKHKIFSFLFFF